MQNYRQILKNKDWIGTTTVTTDGIFFIGVRYGTEYGDMSRGGTWYDIPAFHGERSSYESGKWYSKGIGVGGNKRFERKILLSNPYLFDWTGMGEGWAPVILAEKILGKEYTKKLSRGIKGINAEKAFARIEKAVAESLYSQGYDGVIFYDVVTKNGDIIHPKQAFVFFQ